MHERDNRGLVSDTEFDLLLRSSLESYADPGPEPGLAERVLARMAAEQDAKRLIKLSHGPEELLSGAKAPAYFAGFFGTTEVVPFYKAFFARVRTSFFATIEGERERTRRTKHARRVIRWEIALPVAACLIIAIVLLVSRSLHNAANSINQARVILPKSSDAGGSGLISKGPSVTAQRSDVSRPRRHSSHAAAVATAARLPKLDVFPTTQPLTPEEQALVAYVAHAPEAERKSLIEEQKQLDAPLSIEALEIKPLAPPEPQGN